MTVAKTILQQLGGNRFIAMTGASNLLADNNYLQFKIGKNASKANFVRVTLEPSDTYKMEFIRVHGGKVTVLETYDDVYNNSLQEAFTSYTGMYTSL